MAGIRSIPVFTVIFFIRLCVNPISAGATEPQTVSALKATKQITLTGFTRARATMNIVSQVSERILEIHDDVGDVIGQDGVFAVADSTLTNLDLESNLLNQKKLQSKISYLQKEVKRFATLLRKQSTAEAKFDSLKQELDQASLSLQTLQNEEKRTRELLTRHTIKAPPHWQVIRRTVEPEEWITAGTILAEVGDYRTLVVPFAVDYREYAWLQQNYDNLTLSLPDQNTTTPTRILRVSPGFDPQTRKLNLEMEIRDIPIKRGGIRVELTIEVPDPSGAVLIPEKALSSRYGSFRLTTPAGNEIPVVKLGPGHSPGTVRVTSPAIKPGDRFLTSQQPEEYTDQQ